LQRALDVQQMLAPEDKAKRCDLLLALIGPLANSGEPTRAHEREAEEAFALAEALGDSERASRVCMAATGAVVAHGAAMAAITPPYRLWAERLDHYAAPESPARVAALLAPTAVPMEQSLEKRHEALEMARRIGDSDAFLQAALVNLVYFLPPEDEREHYDLAREVASIPLEGANALWRARVLVFAAQRLLEWGERTEAENLWAQFDGLARLTATHDMAMVGYFLRIQRLTIAGRLRDVVATRDEAVAVSREIGRDLSGLEGSSFFSRAAILLGKPETALAHFRAWNELLGRGDAASPVVGTLLAHAGHQAEAREISLQALEQYGSYPIGLGTHGMCARLETAVMLGDEAATATFAEPLRLLSGMIAFQGQATSVARLLGDAEALLGRSAAARDYYTEALSACESIGFRPEIAITRLNLAELLLRDFPEERSAAMEHLDFAIAEFEAMEMAPSLQRALRLRGRRRAAPPEAVEPAYPDGLSDREVGVLRLLAAGMSNQQIADELVISLNTVRRHVSNIFAKANLRNRAEAGVYAQRLNLTQ
jgi:DNA-binding CsgD family transcriptional regulator